MNPEIGRELTVADLQPKQVVVIAPPDKDFHLTMWVEAVDDISVVFFSAVMDWHVLNLIENGKIIDDRGRQVHVFEYLGKI